MYKKDFQQTRRLLRAVSPLCALSHNNYTEDDTKVDAVSNTIRKIIYMSDFNLLQKGKKITEWETIYPEKF